MTKSTPILTLTQSGPMAVLLQRQRDAVIQLDRHAHRKHMRAAFWKTLTWPFRALTARTLVDYTGRRQQIHDDLRIQHPEWVEANGESSMRLLEQLDTLTRRGPNESIAAPQRPVEQGTKRNRHRGGVMPDSDPLRWRRTSIRQASEKLWAAA
jgi:hypothetical protein